jgi:hypothetical protein
MSEFRLRGQETVIRITSAGTLIATLTAIKSATISFETRQLIEQYLGETVQRVDSIYDKMSGSLVFHPESQDFLVLVQAFVDRAKRRIATSYAVNLTSRLNFANGQKPQINVFDLHPGTQEFGDAGRDQYVGYTLPWNASTAQIILS